MYLTLFFEDPAVVHRLEGDVKGFEIVGRFLNQTWKVSRSDYPRKPTIIYLPWIVGRPMTSTQGNEIMTPSPLAPSLALAPSE